MCERCGAETVLRGRGHAICSECRAKPKTCVECGAQFKSQRRRCGPCYYKTGRRRPCIDCGAPVTLRAQRCTSCHTKRTPSGPANPGWKGGKTHRAGYVYVKRQDGSTIAEHRLVMEQKLGRNLVPGESVHHVNGQRDDNRIENLELWSSCHPAGQRVIDLVAWAKEILARYDP